MSTKKSNAFAPLVTVIMSCYNNEKYVGSAIESILNQSFADFEFIITDDASVDNSLKVIRSYNDSRINLIINKKNIGLTAALNKMVKLSKGKYIARLDSDDLSLPERLKKQVNFMEQNPDTGVCGTGAKLIFSDSEEINSSETNPKITKCLLLFGNPLVHSSVLIRSEVLKKNNLNYDISYKTVQDYDLWLSLSKFADISNLAEILTIRNMHDKQIGKILRTNSSENIEKIRNKNLNNIGIVPTKREEEIHALLSGTKIKEVDLAFVIDAQKWILKLGNACLKKGGYTKGPLFDLLIRKWFFVCKLAKKDDGLIWARFLKSKILWSRGLIFLLFRM